VAERGDYDEDVRRAADALGVTPEYIAELDDIYGYVRPDKRDCLHPNLSLPPSELTAELAGIADEAGGELAAVERRCPDCGAWVSQPRG
jgi:hypothetical protein